MVNVRNLAIELNKGLQFANCVERFHKLTKRPNRKLESCTAISKVYASFCRRNIMCLGWDRQLTCLLRL